MRRKITLFCFLVSIIKAFSQTNDIDSMLLKVALEKDDNIRIDIIYYFFSNTAESDPLLDLKNAQKLLDQSQKSKDKIGESLALQYIGYDYRAFGNTAKSLEYGLKSVEVAQETGNEKLIAATKLRLGNNYKDLGDYRKAINLYLAAGKTADSLKHYVAQTWVFHNLCEVYLLMDEIDSALIYAQKDYQLCERIKYYDYICYTLINLGAIHGKLGKGALAIAYYDMAIKEGIKTNSPKELNWAYTSKGQYFYDANQMDSSIIYAKKAIVIVQNSAFTNYSIKPAELLMDIYEKTHPDSAFKYFRTYKAANDSLFSIKTIQQTQLMTFENELRQRQLADEKISAEKNRNQNIQYALIALGIITFIVLFLLLSRSFITNPKMIKFLGVMGLLIVFEFINLLLHPFLERITVKNPLLMLLALVCIAALLIPFHHKIEKWSIEKLVEKNKKVRLAKAKKTIEELENKNINI